MELSAQWPRAPEMVALSHVANWRGNPLPEARAARSASHSPSQLPGESGPRRASRAPCLEPALISRPAHSEQNQVSWPGSAILPTSWGPLGSSATRRLRLPNIWDSCRSQDRPQRQCQCHRGFRKVTGQEHVVGRKLVFLSPSPSPSPLPLPLPLSTPSDA